VAPAARSLKAGRHVHDDTARLQDLSARHVWGHFSQLAPSNHSEIEVIERGEGCYVWDTEGRRYLDGLAGLFTVQAGHGRRELAEAGARQAERLAYFPMWTYTHPAAIELSARLAALAPGDLKRVFLTTGGAEAVESAWKLARQYHRLNGEPGRYKAISRKVAYHGTTMGALSLTGVTAIRSIFEPLVPGAVHVENTNRYRCAFCASGPACTLQCADDIERAIVREGPETVAAVFLEPVQNAGGCFTPPAGYFERVREICDRHGVLLVSDEVICAFGRLGSWFGADRVGSRPDMITMAKGLTSGYAPLGGVMVSDRVAEPFLAEGESFLHGITFGGHPVSCAVALANLEVMEREDLPGRVLAHEDGFRSALESLLDLPWVGDVRGMGYFYGIELVKDHDTKASFSEDEGHRLLRGLLSPRLFHKGLICRADDRGDPVIQLSPALVAGPEQFDEIATAIREALIESMKELGR
jgi:adenosylmethionine-8-amino-7-oxononanoate aminotransferase